MRSLYPLLRILLAQPSKDTSAAFKRNENKRAYKNQEELLPSIRKEKENKRVCFRIPSYPFVSLRIPCCAYCVKRFALVAAFFSNKR